MDTLVSLKVVALDKPHITHVTSKGLLSWKSTQIHSQSINFSVAYQQNWVQFSLTNLYLQTIFSTLTNSQGDNCPISMFQHCSFSISRLIFSKGLVINSLCVDQSGISCCHGPDLRNMVAPKTGESILRLVQHPIKWRDNPNSSLLWALFSVMRVRERNAYPYEWGCVSPGGYAE